MSQRFWELRHAVDSGRDPWAEKQNDRNKPNELTVRELGARFVFPSERSDHIHEDTLTDEIHDVFELLGIDEANFHSTRHTVKTNLSKLRVLAEIRDRIMNHSIQKKTVGQIYDHYDYFDERIEALIKWEEQLKEIVGIR